MPSRGIAQHGHENSQLLTTLPAQLSAIPDLGFIQHGYAGSDRPIIIVMPSAQLSSMPHPGLIQYNHAGPDHPTTPAFQPLPMPDPGLTPYGHSHTGPDRPITLPAQPPAMPDPGLTPYGHSHTGPDRPITLPAQPPAMPDLRLIQHGHAGSDHRTTQTAQPSAIPDTIPLVATSSGNRSANPSSPDYPLAAAEFSQICPWHKRGKKCLKMYVGQCPHRHLCKVFVSLLLPPDRMSCMLLNKYVDSPRKIPNTQLQQ